MPASAPFPAWAERPCVLQPCGEACAGFRPFGRDGWHDYGICAHPRSPRRGFPARIGRDCRNFVPAGTPLPPPARETEVD